MTVHYLNSRRPAAIEQPMGRAAEPRSSASWDMGFTAFWLAGIGVAIAFWWWVIETVGGWL